MNLWKMAGLTMALVGAAGFGAALAPVAEGQTVRVVTPRSVTPAAAVQVFGFGGRIGVSVRDVETGDATAKGATGVIVESVEEESPAAKAGFRKGDLVVEFDGERVRSVRQFQRLITETPEGRTVPAAVQRDGQRVTLNVTPRASGALRAFEGDSWRALEELRSLPRPSPRPAPRAEVPRPNIETFMWSGSSQLGMTVTDLSSQLAEYFGTKDGVLVSAVRDDSAAARAGVKAGDVITTINGNSVTNAIELRRRIQRIEAGEEFTLDIVRDKKPMTLKGKVESRSRRGTIL